MFGATGNDFVLISPLIKATTLVDGGMGNDRIFGGGGPNILLGGPGDDTLFGGIHRDILIGGDGHDTIFGSAGDDILIGGTTAYDTDVPSLLQIMGEWNSSDSFAVRQQKLATGADGLPILDATTVTDDGVRDLLFARPGHDWIFAGVHDRTF